MTVQKEAPKTYFAVVWSVVTGTSLPLTETSQTAGTIMSGDPSLRVRGHVERLNVAFRHGWPRKDRIEYLLVLCGAVFVRG